MGYVSIYSIYNSMILSKYYIEPNIQDIFSLHNHQRYFGMTLIFRSSFCFPQSWFQLNIPSCCIPYTIKLIQRYHLSTPYLHQTLNLWYDQIRYEEFCSLSQKSSQIIQRYIMEVVLPYTRPYIDQVRCEELRSKSSIIMGSYLDYE